MNPKIKNACFYFQIWGYFFWARWFRKRANYVNLAINDLASYVKMVNSFSFVSPSVIQLSLHRAERDSLHSCCMPKCICCPVQHQRWYERSHQQELSHVRSSKSSRSSQSDQQRAATQTLSATLYMQISHIIQCSFTWEWLVILLYCQNILDILFTVIQYIHTYEEQSTNIQKNCVFILSACLLEERLKVGRWGMMKDDETKRNKSAAVGLGGGKK